MDMTSKPEPVNTGDPTEANPQTMDTTDQDSKVSRDLNNNNDSENAKNASRKPVSKKNKNNPIAKLKDAIYHRAADAIRKHRASMGINGPQTKFEIRSRVRMPLQLHPDDLVVYKSVLSDMINQYNPPPEVVEDLETKMLGYVLQPPTGDGKTRANSARIHHSQAVLMKTIEPLPGSSVLVVYNNNYFDILPQADHVLDVRSIWPGFSHLDVAKQRITARLVGVHCSSGLPIPCSMAELSKISNEFQTSLSMFKSVPELKTAAEFGALVSDSQNDTKRRFWIKDVNVDNNSGDGVAFAMLLQTPIDIDRFRGTLAKTIIDPAELGVFETVSLALQRLGSVLCYNIMADPVKMATSFFGADSKAAKTAQFMSAVDFPASGAAIVMMSRAPTPVDVRSCLFWFSHFSQQHKCPAMAIVYPKSDAPFGTASGECDKEYLTEMRVVVDAHRETKGKVKRGRKQKEPENDNDKEKDRDSGTSDKQKERHRDRDRDRQSAGDDDVDNVGQSKQTQKDTAIVPALVGTYEVQNKTWALFETKCL